MVRTWTAVSAVSIAAVLVLGFMPQMALALPDVKCVVDADPPHGCTNGGDFCRLGNRPGICQTTSLGCACSSGKSVSGVHLIQLSCTNTGTHDVVTFGVQDQESFGVCEVHLVPMPQPPVLPDSCQIYAASPPSGWTSTLGTVVSGPSGASFYATPGFCIPPGAQLAPYQIVCSTPGCCYQVVIRDDQGNYDDAGTVCFDCSHATATHSESWGRMKAIYR